MADARMTPGCRRTVDELARLVRQVVDGGLDADWFEEAGDALACWQEHANDIELEEAKSR